MNHFNALNMILSYAAPAYFNPEANSMTFEIQTGGDDLIVEAFLTAVRPTITYEIISVKVDTRIKKV